MSGLAETLLPPGNRLDARLGVSQKVFGVLEIIASAGRPLSVAELVVLLDVPKPTMHRIVRQLVTEGLLLKEPLNRGYGPGPRLLRLALEVVRVGMRSAPRHAVLEKLSARTGETCNFGVISGNVVVYLDRVEAAWPFGLKFEPGSRVPIHCTSMGKLLLAFQPRRRRQQLIGSLALDRYTENTITDPGLLANELAGIRSRGYAIDNQEFLAGVICLAVPVHDARGHVCAALAISAPQARMSVVAAEDHIPAMLEAIADLASLLYPESGLH